MAGNIKGTSNFILHFPVKIERTDVTAFSKIKQLILALSSKMIIVLSFSGYP